MKSILSQLPQLTVCSIDTINSSQLILTCPNGTSLNQLPFASSDILSLSSITSFHAQGENNTRGPFTSIPSNICWMSNLITLNLTFNQLANILNYSDFLNCSISWKIIDLSYNYLTTFPSTLFTLNRFNSVYLNANQLSSIDLSIVALVQNIVDLRYNRITSIINPTNFNISLNLQTGDTLILLDGNSMPEFTDTIYEMYGSCEELHQGLTGTLDRSALTFGLGNIDFGTTQVNCSCNQYYIIAMLHVAFGTPVLGRISNLLCVNQPVNFVNYTCSLGYSTVNFTQVQPRLCQLDDWNRTTTMTTTLAASTSTVTTNTTTLTTATMTTPSTTSTETTMLTTTKTTTASTTTTTATITTSTTSSTTSTKTTTSITTTISTELITTITSTTSTKTTTSTTTVTSTASTATTASTGTTTITTSTTSLTASTTPIIETKSTSSSTSTSSTTAITSSTITTTASRSTTPTALTTSSATTTMASISTVNTTACLATFFISDTNLLLTCPSNANVSLFPINNYALMSLDRITSIRIEGYNGARGPLQTIPSNICFLTNLQVLNVSFNRLSHLDSSYLLSNPTCLQTLQTLDMSSNYLTEFPSLFLIKIPNLQQLFLQTNQLTSLDLALCVLVSTSINLSNNQISKITNNANVNISTYTYSWEAFIDLTNNSQIIDLTDAIYEMYGACYEIYQMFNNSIPSKSSLLTPSFLNINFGTAKINCTCNQYYIQKSFIYSFGNSLPSGYSLSNTMCTDGTLFYNNTNIAACSTSSVNFMNTRPRLCKIKSNDGNLTLVNTTEITTGIYPYYLTQTMNNSYCLFTFYVGGKRVSIDCINGSSALTEISFLIFNNIHFRNITQVSINNQSSLYELPFYLCSLPSTSIDLSNQSFLNLNKDTFPCLFNSILQTINLSYNQINTINVTVYNWTLIDLTSNNLTQFPYTLFNSNQNPTSIRQLFQRNLLLQFNKLTQFDLFIYTYPNTYINLENNPFSKTINGYNILNNYQKQSLRNSPISTNIILSNQMHFLLNDQIAQNYNTCDTHSLSYLIELFQYMKNTNIIVEIQCDCSAIYIKEYYSLLNSSEKITNRFSCSNISTLTIIQFESLTEIDCLANITLSSDRLCQFQRIENYFLSDKPISNDNGGLLAIILGSVLGSLGVILIVALIIAGIYYKRKSSVKATQISTISRAPYTNTNRFEVHRPYQSQTIDDTTISQSTDYSRTRIRDIPSFYINSRDLSEQENNYHKKRRRPKEPAIDYDINSDIFYIEDPSQV